MDYGICKWQTDGNYSNKTPTLIKNIQSSIIAYWHVNKFILFYFRIHGNKDTGLKIFVGVSSLILVIGKTNNWGRQGPKYCEKHSSVHTDLIKRKRLWTKRREEVGLRERGCGCENWIRAVQHGSDGGGWTRFCCCRKLHQHTASCVICFVRHFTIILLYAVTQSELYGSLPVITLTAERMW
jgi:hypothetical protein